MAGESALWVDPAEIPVDDDIGRLGRALAAGRHGALTIAQVDQAARVITVDRKVVEVAGHLYVEVPKNRKLRRTIYPAERRAATRSPSGTCSAPPP